MTDLLSALTIEPMGCSSCALGTTANPGGNFVGVRLADAEDGRVTIVLSGEVRLVRGERIIVETENGPEIAEVTTTDPVLVKSCASRKAKRFLRLASDREQSDFIDRLELQERAAAIVRRRVEEQRLAVKLVKCQAGWDRRRLMVVYSSEEKVSLRDLCRELSEELGIRVESRSVGVRDETRSTGGIGPCGLTLCCSTWMRGFHPVTIKMAKIQGITPNPSKLTGMCGRLKCCLAYELEGGIEAARRMAQKLGDKRPGGAPAPPPPAAPPEAPPA